MQNFESKICWEHSINGRMNHPEEGYKDKTRMRLGQDNVEWRALLKVALTYCAESTIRNL
jgi:hypothetical protein